MKRLYRSKEERMFLGICGGMGEYLGIDPTILRVVWALLACTIFGAIAYLICGLIIPENPNQF